MGKARKNIRNSNDMWQTRSDYTNFPNLVLDESSNELASNMNKCGAKLMAA